MRHHLDALIVLRRVWSAFAVILAVALLILCAGSGLSLQQAHRLGAAQRGVVYLFAGGAVVCALVGATGFAAANGLRRRQASGRLTTLLLSLLDIVLIPFGTALAIYTFWVLLNNDARREFGRPLRGVLPPSDADRPGS